MDRKGAELALNIVIIAAIGLIVLTVLLFVLWGKGVGPFSKGVSDCAALGGTCEENSCMALSPPRPGLFSGDCPVQEGEPRKYCCAKVS